MKPDATSSRIGLVTVSFRSADAVDALLTSVPGATRNSVRSVVVDNYPDGDADLDAVCEAHGATLVSRPDNPGYGGGVNAGVATFGDDVDWILVINPDVVLGAGSLDVLIDAAASDDRIGAVGPRIVDDEGTTYPSARAIPSLRVGVGHALFGDVAPTNPWTRTYHRHADYDTIRDAGWLSGACILVRRRAFDDVRGFDDDFFMYFEDVDLGYRLGKSGWRNVFVPGAIVEHEGGHSTKRVSGVMNAAHHASARLWVAKRYPGPWRWPIRAVVNVGLRLRELLASRD